MFLLTHFNYKFSFFNGIQKKTTKLTVDVIHCSYVLDTLHSSESVM